METNTKIAIVGIGMFLATMVTVYYLLNVLSASREEKEREQAEIEAAREPSEITCYSGGNVIYRGLTKSRIEMLPGGKSWQVKELPTENTVSRNTIRVSGDCVIRSPVQ